MAHRSRAGAPRGATFWVGAGLMLAGTVLLGYVAWQYFGTNVVSRHKQQQLVEDTRRSWAAASSGHGSTTGVDTAAALVRIPRFGSHYVMPVRQGVGAAVLAEGFGQFPDSVDPGQVGNYAIAAHRVTHGEPLRHMPDLRPGDQVIVETAGRTYVYRLDSDPNRLVVSFRDVWVISPLPHNPHGGVQPAQRPGQRLITLTTCSELFHTDNRMVAFGHLVSTRRD